MGANSKNPKTNAQNTANTKVFTLLMVIKIYKQRPAIKAKIAVLVPEYDIPNNWKSKATEKRNLVRLRVAFKMVTVVSNAETAIKIPKAAGSVSVENFLKLPLSN